MNGDKEPAIRDYFLWSFPGATGGWLAINPAEGTNLDEFQGLVQNELVAGVPDMFGFTLRRSLFGGFESSNAVEMRLAATDVDALKPAVARAMQLIPEKMPGASAQPQPDPFAEATELRFSPNDVRLAEVGWNRQDLTRVVMKLGQGVWLGEYFTGRERVDIYLKTTRFNTPEEMAALPMATPAGGVVPLGELATVSIAPSPSMIARINRTRVYSVIVNPPEGMSLEALIDELQEFDRTRDSVDAARWWNHSVRRQRAGPRAGGGNPRRQFHHGHWSARTDHGPGCSAHSRTPCSS